MGVGLDEFRLFPGLHVIFPRGNAQVPAVHACGEYAVAVGVGISQFPFVVINQSGARDRLGAGETRLHGFRRDPVIVQIPHDQAGRIVIEDHIIGKVAHLRIVFQVQLHPQALGLHNAAARGGHPAIQLSGPFVDPNGVDAATQHETLDVIFLRRVCPSLIHQNIVLVGLPVVRQLQRGDIADGAGLLPRLKVNKVICGKALVVFVALELASEFQLQLVVAHPCGTVGVQRLVAVVPVNDLGQT